MQMLKQSTKEDDLFVDKATGAIVLEKDVEI